VTAAASDAVACRGGNGAVFADGSQCPQLRMVNSREKRPASMILYKKNFAPSKDIKISLIRQTALPCGRGLPIGKRIGSASQRAQGTAMDERVSLRSQLDQATTPTPQAAAIGEVVSNSRRCDRSGRSDRRRTAGRHHRAGWRDYQSRWRSAKGCRSPGRRHDAARAA